MGQYHELGSADAVKQLKEIVGHQRVCMMMTNPSHYPSSTRPMDVSEVDDNGVFWFLSLRTSEKFSDLEKDPRITLHISNSSDQEYLTIHGQCEILNDRARMKELWNPFAKVWVPDGVEDPDLRILKVTPTDGYYWDTKDGKVVAAAKMAFALITGNTGQDGGVEGHLKV